MSQGGGWLYALVDEHAAAVKVGMTKDLFRRYMDAANWNPWLRVHSESWHADAWRAEQAVHAQLAHARLPAWGPRFEWFKLSDPEVGRWLTARTSVDLPVAERIAELREESGSEALRRYGRRIRVAS